MSRFQEAIQRAERAEALASRLEESLAASQEYIVTVASRGDTGAPKSDREVEELNGRLREIESRLSYRVLQRMQNVITQAIPPQQHPC